MCTKKRLVWVDLAKLVAIFAVMVDHACFLLYSDRRVMLSSYFSVSLFILIMGVTSFKTISEKTTYAFPERSWRIFEPYLVASFVYSLYAGRWTFDLQTYLDCLWHFNAAPPLYYVLLYVQLLVAVPVLYRFFSKGGYQGILREMCGLLAVILFAWFTTNRTNVLSVYGGGGKLFGGTYLVILYIGMFFGKYSHKIRLGKRASVTAWLVSCAMVAAWCRFLLDNQFQLDSKIPFGPGLNPPSITLIVYSCLIAAALFFFGALLDFFPGSFWGKFFRRVSWFGKHTLYIFLYHWFWRDALSVSTVVSSISCLWLKWIVYFSTMVFGSLAIEMGYKAMRSVFVKSHDLEKSVALAGLSG